MLFLPLLWVVVAPFEDDSVVPLEPKDEKKSIRPVPESMFDSAYMFFDI